MAINLIDLLKQDAANVRAEAEQVAAREQQIAANTAEIERQKAQAAADVQAKVARFAQAGNIEELLVQQVQEFNRASAEARIAKFAATQRLADLEESASTSLWGDPLGWLNNQMTFDDKLAQAKLSTAVAESKDAETKAVQDQITALNNMTQETARTFAVMSQSISADMIEKTAQNTILAGQNAAWKAKQDGIRAGNDYLTKARQLEFQEEDQAMQRERQKWAREEHAKQMEAARSDKNAFDTMWRTAELGAATMGKSIGNKPASRQEFEMIYKTNPILQAALSVGYNKIAGKTNVLGDSLVESASLLKTTEARGNAGTEKQVEYLKNQLDVAMRDPTLAAYSKEMQKSKVEESLVKEYQRLGVNADNNPANNPTRLPAPSVVLNRSTEGLEPKVAAMQKQLLASPFISDLMKAQLHLDDKPARVVEFASSWAKQNNVSISAVSDQVAAMYALTRQYHNEAAKSVGLPPVKPKYEAAYKGFFGSSLFDPANPEDVQKQLTAKERSAKLEQSLRAAAAGYGYGYGR